MIRPMAKKARPLKRRVAGSRIRKKPIRRRSAPSLRNPRVISQRFLSVLPDSGTVLLTSHDNPDPDVLASSLALKTLIQRRTKLTPHIAIGGILGRAENRALTLELEMDLYPMDLLEHQHWDAIVMVDAQPGAGNANLPKGMEITAVIDHHPLRQALKVPFADVRPDYGAASTILVEYLKAQRIEWDKKLATALFYAIKSETQDLGRSICEADKRAHFALYDSVDWELLHRILSAKIPGDYFGIFQRGIAAAKLYGNALIADLGDIPTPDAAAEIADFLLRHENVIRALVIGQYEEQLVFSIRFAREDLDAGIIAANMARGYGTGGGHDQMAGGRIGLTKLRQLPLQEIEDILTDRFLEQVDAAQFKPGLPMLAEGSSGSGTSS